MQRIYKESDFNSIKTIGLKKSCSFFILKLKIRDSFEPLRSLPGLGIVTSKRIGNAVVRNKIKRIFLNIVFKNRSVLGNNHDLLIFAKNYSLSKSFHLLSHQFNKCYQDMISKIS